MPLAIFALTFIAYAIGITEFVIFDWLPKTQAIYTEFCYGRFATASTHLASLFVLPC